MLPAARKSDVLSCPSHGGGLIEGPCCSHVQIGGAPSARAGDAGHCGSSGTLDTIRRGNPLVLIQNEPAAGMTHATAHGGMVATGCGNVFLGDPPVDANGNLLPVPPDCMYLWKGLGSVPTRGDPAEGLNELRDPFKLSPPRRDQFTFRDREDIQPVRVYLVEIRGHTIEIIEPVGGTPAPGGGWMLPPAGVWVPDARMVAAGLATLSDEQLSRIRRTVISPHHRPPPGGAAAADARGDESLVTFFPRADPHPQSDIDWTLAHEGAHAMSHGWWAGDPPKGRTAEGKAWDAAMQADARGVSRYGNTNAQEDFAEAVLMYAMTKGTPCEATARALFPARYAFLDRLFPNGYRPRRKKP